MNDLIRREDALEAIIDERTHTILQAWINVKKTVPSVDAIEVVRCEECKYKPICNHSVQHTTHDAYSVTIGSKTVEWCSYGEREGE